MATLNNSSAYDLWVDTLSSYEYGEQALTQAMERNVYWFLDKVWPQRDTPPPGTDIKWQVGYREGVGITWSAPGVPRTRATQNAQVTMTIPWAEGYGQMTMIAAEIRRNMGRSKLKNLRNARYSQAFLDVAAGLDDAFFGMPDTTDNLKPYGLRYYFTPITAAINTAAIAGTANYYFVYHQGGNPSGFSARSGVNLSTAAYARLKNLNGAWTNNSGDITEVDLQRMGEMATRLQFKVPTGAQGGIKAPKGNNWFMPTNMKIVNSFSAACRARNETMKAAPAMYYGAGINPIDGSPVFWQTPLVWASPLDNSGDGDTTALTECGYNPLYMLNLNYIRPQVEAGMAISTDTPPRSNEQPDVFTTYFNFSFNIKVSDPQKAGGLMSYPYV